MRLVVSPLLCLLFISSTFFCYSQRAAWEWVNPHLNGNRINGIDVVPGAKSIIVSYDDGLLVSRDEGVLWRLQSKGYKMSRVFEFSSTLAVGLSTDGKIIRDILSDSPELVYEGIGERYQFYDLFLDPQTGVGLCVGGYEVHEPLGNGSIRINNWGVVVRTTDFGKHWSVVYEKEGDELKGIVYNGETFTAYGTERYNFVVQSDDGITWALNNDYGLGNLPIQKIAFVNDKVGFMTFESHGNLYHTTNGGKSWVLRKDFDNATYQMTASDSTIAVSTYTSLFVSGDRGVTWTERKITPSGMMLTGLVNDKNLIVAMDQLEGISIARDSDHNFINVNDNLVRRSITANSTFVLFGNQTVFTSPQVGYMPLNRSNYSSELWKTTDGGCHWNRLANYPGASGTGLLHFLDDQVGFVLSNDLYKTIDGGATWTKMTIPFGASAAHMDFFSETTGIAISSDEFWRTTDGGLTWTEISHPYIGYTSSKLFVLDETHAFACFGENKFLKTVDAGLTWTLYPTPFDEIDWTALHFFDANNGIMAGDEDFFVNGEWTTARYLIRTNNGGITWTKVMDLPENATEIKFLNATYGVMIGDNGMYLATYDGGITWNRQHTIAKKMLTNAFLFDDVQYLTGEYQIVIKSSTSFPKANFEISSAPRCQGDSIVAINNSTDAVSYLWKIDGKEVSRERELKVKVKPSGNVLVELAAGTCNLTHYDVASTSVAILESPKKPALMVNGKRISDELILCDSSYIAKPTQSYYAYQWSNGKGTPEIVLNNEAALSLKVLNELGCATSSDTTLLKHQQKPVAAFKIDYDIASKEVAFVNTSESATTYYWNLGDGTTFDGSDVKHYFADEARTYTATLIASAYCGKDTVAQSFSVIVLGTEVYNDDDVAIYPNPLKKSSLGQLNTTTAKQYSITTVSGNIITPKTPIVDARIPITCKDAGVYLLLLYDQNKLLTVKRILVE